MGADQSVPARPPLDPKQLSTHLQWCIQQTARIQHQQSLQHALLFSPLLLPSSPQPSTAATTSLLTHLSSSLTQLYALIDTTLTNKDANQSGLTPKDERFRGYDVNKETNPSLAQLGASDHVAREAGGEEEWSREERLVAGCKWVQCSALCSSLLAATVQGSVLQDQKVYLQKRLHASDYVRDHAGGALAAAESDVTALLPLLSSARAMLASTYKDAHLYSLLFLCHEWMRVLRGLQSVWINGKGKLYTPPTDLPPSTTPSTPLIGISLTNPPQSHLAPATLSPTSSISPQHLQDLLDALLGKARQVDYALHRNEMSTVNDALAVLATGSGADRLFSVDGADLRRVGGRVAAVLQLQRRSSISAREIDMGVNNMRNRLSTLTTAITQLTQSSPHLSRRSLTNNTTTPTPAGAAYSEQLDKLVAEAHMESRALRDVFTLFYPQLVSEVVVRLDHYGYRQVREREEMIARLRTMETTAVVRGAEAGNAGAVVGGGRPSTSMAVLPPPVPRRPSISYEEKEKRHMPSAALVQSQSPTAVVDDDDGVAVITVTDDADHPHHHDNDDEEEQERLALRTRLARDEQAAMARAGHERRNSNPLAIHAIALETPGHTQHWWKEAPVTAGGEVEKEEEGGEDVGRVEERPQVVEYSYGDESDGSDGSPSSQATHSSPSTTPNGMSVMSVYPLVSPTNTASPSLDSRYPIATVPGTNLPVLAQVSPSLSPNSSSSSVITQPPPPPPRPAVPPPLPAGYMPGGGSVPSSPRRAGSGPIVGMAPPPLPSSSSAPSLPSLVSAEATNGVNVNATRPSSRRRMPQNSIDISATPSFSISLASLLPPRTAANTSTTTSSPTSSASAPPRDDSSPHSATSAPPSSPSPASPSTPQPRSIIKKGGGGARRRSTSGQRVSFSEVVEERSVGGGREERAGVMGVSPSGGGGGGGGGVVSGSRRESYEYNNRLAAGDEWLDRKELRLGGGPDGVFYAHSPRYI